MIPNRILDVILMLLAWIVVPAQLVTALALGFLVSLPFGSLLLLSISLVWMVLFFPMIGASWLCSRAEPLRYPIGLLGIPWAVVASTYVCLMPSMGELESRAAKLLLAKSWPFSWEYWQFQIGRLNLAAAEANSLREIIMRMSRDPLERRTIDRLARREELDGGVIEGCSQASQESSKTVALELDANHSDASDEEASRSVGKPINEALFDLAMISVLKWVQLMRSEDLEHLFATDGRLKIVASPQYYAICRESASYFGGRIWLRVKSEMPRTEQEDRIVDFIGSKVSRVLRLTLEREGLAEPDIASHVDANTQYTLAQIGEYEKVGPNSSTLLRKLETSLASAPQLSRFPQIMESLAKALESAFDQWANDNPSAFLPSALSSEEISSVLYHGALSFRGAVDICAKYGNLYAELNEAHVIFKAESRLPASRETIKAALRLSLRADPRMSENDRRSHDYMYPQLALFVSDGDARRAIAFAREPYVEMIGGQATPSIVPLRESVMYFGFPAFAPERYAEGKEWFGSKFYNSEYFGGRDSADAVFMRSLALRSWEDMEALAREWRDFVKSIEL